MRKRLSSAILVTVLALGFAATVSAAFWGIALGRLDWARTWGGAYYYPPEEPGSISGVVTDADGNPIEGAWVAAGLYDDSWWAQAWTDADGSYTIDRLTPGEYRVEVWAEGYLHEYYDSVRQLEDAAPVAVKDGDDTPNIDFDLDPGGSISGIVTDAQGNPIEGAWVGAGLYDGSWWGQAASIADGTYKITGLVTGEYRVDVWAEGYLHEYYNGMRQPEDATPASVLEGQETPNINFSLDLGGTISGIVTDAQGNPIEGAWVEAYSDDGGGWGDAETGSDGTYKITGLVTGEYRVDVWAEGYFQQFYDGVRDWELATLVPVVEGQDTPNINFGLDLGGTISGIVTDAQGNPIEGAWVEAYSDNGNGWGNAETGSDGSYNIGGLVAGEYRVEIWADGYLHEFYNSVRDWELATLVPVVEGQDTPNINFSLDVGGTLSGIVTDAQGMPIEGAWVHAQSDDGSGWGYTETSPDGFYNIGGLATGEYRVEVWADGYLHEYYNSVRDWGLATLVPVVEGQDTPNINFSLDVGGTISGIVTDTQGNPIDGAWVHAQSDDGSGWGYTETGPDGFYNIGGLATSEYRVEVRADGYLREYYDGVRDWENATLVPVVEGQDTPNINFSLDVGGTISGIVTDAQGNPIEGAWAEAYANDGSGWGYAETDAEGSYKIVGLASSEYLVEVWADGYLHEYYDGAHQTGDATFVGVTEGQDTLGIDFSLDVGGTISGVVTDAQGNPIEGAWVGADREGGGGGGDAQTDADGSYQIDGLATGEYLVLAGAYGYLGEFYDGVRNWEDATLAPVVEVRDTPNINFRLDVGGTISGIVTDAQGNPIERAWVETESVDGNGRSYARTGPDGSYKTIGLASGEYRVDVWVGGYLQEYYDGVRDRDDAVPVAVVEGQDTPGIDFILHREGTISGIVTDEGESPIKGASVYATSSEGSELTVGTQTENDGSYMLHGLSSDRYFVWASAPGFEEQYYNGVQYPQDATSVGVTEGNDTPNINFVLKAVPGGTPTPVPGPLRLEIDADITNGSGPCAPIDVTSAVAVGQTYQVAVCVAGLPAPLGVFQVDIDYDDTLSVAAEIACPAGDCLDDNPDANAGSTTWGDGLGDGWDCNILDLSEPVGDRDPETGADHGRASISCWSLVGPYTFGDDESSGVLGLVQFIAIGTGSNGLTLSNVQMGNAMAAEMGSCNPSTDVPMPCTGAVVEQGEVHTGTPTPTPSPPIVPPATGPGATSTATPNADGTRDSRGVPRITPPATATATPASGSSSYVIAPTSQVAPVTVEPPAAADRGTTIGLPGAGDGGYLGHEDTSRALWPWLAAGTVAAILAATSVIFERRRRKSTMLGDGR
jgi:protocatechuate 3,4-dioxygenase beta subunit